MTFNDLYMVYLFSITYRKQDQWKGSEILCAHIFNFSDFEMYFSMDTTKIIKLNLFSKRKQIKLD